MLRALLSWRTSRFGLVLLVACSRGQVESSGASASLVHTTPASEPMVLARGVPGPPATAAPGRCPPEMASVGEVCIDRWEAHLVTVEGGVSTRLEHVKRPLPGVRYEARSAAGVMPQGYVSRTEAAEACEHAGKRLCTADEWLSACEGREARTYPYGNKLQKGACNSDKPHLMQAIFGSDMSIYTFALHYNSPKLNQQEGFLAATGQHADCVSPEGVHDLVGNLHEWVADDVNARFRDKLRERKVNHNVFESAKDGNGAFLGGFYSTKEQLGTGCGYITVAHEPAYHDYSTGFRCCR